MPILEPFWRAWNGLFWCHFGHFWPFWPFLLEQNHPKSPKIANFAGWWAWNCQNYHFLLLPNLKLKVTFGHSLRLSLSQNGCQMSVLITDGLFSWVFFGFFFLRLDSSFIFHFLKKMEKLREQRAKSILGKLKIWTFLKFGWLEMFILANLSILEGENHPKSPKIAENHPKSPNSKFENCLKICFLVVEWRKVEVKNNTESFYTWVLLTFGMCLLWHLLKGFVISLMWASV